MLPAHFCGRGDALLPQTIRDFSATAERELGPVKCGPLLGGHGHREAEEKEDGDSVRPHHRDQGSRDK